MRYDSACRLGIVQISLGEKELIPEPSQAAKLKNSWVQVSLGTKKTLRVHGLGAGGLEV